MLYCVCVYCENLTENHTAITPFKVMQCHWFWYQLKARIRLPISD